MKLNPACIRDILLTVEDVCDFKKSWRYDYQSNDAPRLAEVQTFRNYLPYSSGRTCKVTYRCSLL